MASDAWESGLTTGTPSPLSPHARAIYRLLSASDSGDALLALHQLPEEMQQRLSALSALEFLSELRAPLIVLMHDRDDLVIPVSESHQLDAALAGRPGARYTEFAFFEHVAPPATACSACARVEQVLRGHVRRVPRWSRMSSMRRLGVHQPALRSATG